MLSKLEGFINKRLIGNYDVLVSRSGDGNVVVERSISGRRSTPDSYPSIDAALRDQRRGMNNATTLSTLRAAPLGIGGGLLLGGAATDGGPGMLAAGGVLSVIGLDQTLRGFRGLARRDQTIKAIKRFSNGL